MKKYALIGAIITAFLLVAAGQTASPVHASGFVYRSPRPGSRHIHPETTLAVREGRALDPAILDTDIFTVVGSTSGIHRGRNALSDDGRTLLFYPDEAFDYGETVSVSVRSGLQTADGSAIERTSFRFTTMERPLSPAEIQAATRLFEIEAAERAPQETGPYLTHPEIQNILTATVTTKPQLPGSGYIFLTGIGTVTSANMILEESGEPVYIGLPPEGLITADLKVVQYQGEDHLAFSAGSFQGGWSYGATYLLDDTYSLVESWTIANGYGSDFHDFQVLSNDHVLLLGYVPKPYDLSPYGGPVDGVIIDVVIQEQDTGKNVVFEWHGIDFFSPGDSNAITDVSPSDYVHSNAIELDMDGNLLLSSRHLSEITKIDRSTGEIIWRLGGAHNEFNFVNDIGFTHQHDIRRLDNGNISLFDNGNGHSPQHSRALEYEIDEIGKTVTRVWVYPADTSLFTPFMANAQRLDNGNTMIGWGGIPMYTEVLSDTTRAYEAELSGWSYRAYRFDWSAVPAASPRAAVATSPSPITATVHASWNGATGVTGYEVFAGPNTGSMTLVTTATRSGFETQIPLTGLPPGTCVFQVRPVHEDLVDPPYSNFAYRSDLPECWELLNVYFFPIIGHEWEP